MCRLIVHSIGTSNESFSIEFWVKRDGGIAAGDPTEVAIGRDDAVPANSLQWWVGIRWR